MLEHHLQREIVQRLAFEPSLRFRDLKPDDLDSKLFTYHLKKTISAGYVSKESDGNYALTAEGRRMVAVQMDRQQEVADIAESVLFLVIRRKADGAWLLYIRNTHPLKDRVGFMHATPSADYDTAESASKACLEKTGLTCVFKPQGGGYFRVKNGDKLERFPHFTLLVCEDAQGELAEHDDYAHYAWHTDPDFTAPDMLPNMPILVEHYLSGKPFFIDKTLQL